MSVKSTKPSTNKSVTLTINMRWVYNALITIGFLAAVAGLAYLINRDLTFRKWCSDRNGIAIQTSDGTYCVKRESLIKGG